MYTLYYLRYYVHNKQHLTHNSATSVTRGDPLTLEHSESSAPFVSLVARLRPPRRPRQGSEQAAARRRRGVVGVGGGGSQQARVGRRVVVAVDALEADVAAVGAAAPARARVAGGGGRGCVAARRQSHLVLAGARRPRPHELQHAHRSLALLARAL